MPLHALGFSIAHVAHRAAASAANALLSSAFHVPDPLALNIAERGLCFVATAAMRQASHRQAILE